MHNNNHQKGLVNLILLIQITIAVGLMLFGFIFQAEWAEKFMIGVGMIKPMHTQVDYYTYIKGIEYLLCFYYFLIFPVFFMFINNKKAAAKEPVRSLQMVTAIEVDKIKQ
ncbi:MAG: hypothetical protein R6W72_06235 [Desulfurivibrionaceae bacterium]